MIIRRHQELNDPDRRCDFCDAPIIVFEPFWLDDELAVVGCCIACCDDARRELERAAVKHPVE